MQSIKKLDLIYFISLFTLAIISRLIPHPWNFTAVGASAIVAGLVIENKILKIALPILVLVLSDLVIGFHSTVPFVYLGFVFMVGISFLFKNQNTNLKLLIAPTLGSFTFFIISNFGVWLLEAGLYPKTFSGLIECYVMGVPFYKIQFMADVLLTPLIYFALRQVPVLVRAKN